MSGKFKNFISGTYFKSLKWGSLSIVISFLNSIILVPIILSVFSKEIFGLWIILNVIVLLIRSISLGHLNYTSNLVNLYLNKQKDSECFLNQCFTSNLFYLFIQLIALFIISDISILSFFTDYSETFLIKSKASYFIVFYGLSKLISQFSSLFYLRLLEAKGKINLTLKYQSLTEFIELTSIFLAAFILEDFLSMAISSLIVVVISNIYFINKVNRLFEEKISVICENPINLMINQIRNSLFLTMSFLVEKINEIGLNLIVVFSYNKLFVPIFSVSKIVANTALRSSNVVIIPLMPAIQAQFSDGETFAIIRSMKKYWNVSTVVLIFGITVFLPILPYFFNLWTQNKIDYNSLLFGYLFAGILIQSFNVILIEFLKKTNQSKILLRNNILKLICILVGLFSFGFFKYVPGIGMSLLLSEVLALFYLMIQLSSVVEIRNNVLYFSHKFLSIGLFIVNLIYFSIYHQYLLFLIISLLIISSFVMVNRLIKRKD